MQLTTFVSVLVTALDQVLGMSLNTFVTVLATATNHVNHRDHEKWSTPKKRLPKYIFQYVSAFVREDQLPNDLW